MNVQDAMEFLEAKKQFNTAKTFKEKVVVFADTFAYRTKIRARMFGIWLMSVIAPNSVQASGIRCGFNTASGKIRITISMASGDEVSVDYTSGGAKAVIDELQRCVEAVDIGVEL